MTTGMKTPYLNLADSAFSIRSDAVRQARDRGWLARTPYGLAVLRYHEVNLLLKDQRLRQGSYAWPKHNKVEGKFADWWDRIFFNKEGADHARMRRAVNPAFSRKSIMAMQPQFRDIATELVDAFAPSGKCEFMSEFSAPYASRIVCMLLGLPTQEWATISKYASTLGLALGVNFKSEQPHIETAIGELFTYAENAIAKRSHNLGDDFLSHLIKSARVEERISEEELLDTAVLLMFGGIETTRNQLGLAMHTFILHPDQWELLYREPDLAANAVEEVMRTRPTTTWITREATTDFTFQGVDIEKGTTIHLIAESAGTDPETFEPGFDITKTREPHFGFGGGAHHCLGHLIARLDMKEALKLLSQRLRNPVLDGEPVMLPDSGNTGPESLPIRFDAET